MIFHVDCNNFFASCECIEHPELRKVPMAVAGDPEKRSGIVLAKNDLAKRYGVKTTDTVFTARRKCPDIVFVKPRHRFYKQISDRVNTIFLDYTDYVEPASIDESYLDFDTADPVLFADKLRARIREEIGITVSVGISFCKIFAKMGSDYKKPDATTLITRENYREILWPLPVSDLLFVGRSSAETLRRKYILTIGDIASASTDYLVSVLGKQGQLLHDYANGIDPSPVRRFGEHDAARSVSHGSTFPRDLVGYDEIRSAVATLSDDVSRVLRTRRMKGSVIEVKVRHPDLSVTSKQVRCASGTDLQADIRDTAMRLIRIFVRPDEPVRSITVGVSALVSDDAPEQLSFFDDSREKREKIQSAMDDIRSRYGRDTISLGIYRNIPSRFDKEDFNEGD